MSSETNWIPNFTGATETEADSLSSLPSETVPISNEQQSDDLSFDAISRYKLSLTPPKSGGGSVSNSNLSPKGSGSVAVFEEETRSSWSVESTKTTPLKESTVDEDSQNSFGSQKSSLKRPYSDDESPIVTKFTAENLFEYTWPLEKGDYYFLQEQVSDYLSLKSFKRKYPDLARRTVDVDERQFLKDKGVVSETQCDLGLTALRSEDVMELMNRDYPQKYQEYISVLREKEQQNINDKQKEHTHNVDKTRIKYFIKKAVKSAAEYNSHLNSERKEERRSCIDLQTLTIHYPVGPPKPKPEPTPMGKYPVSLLPGQYQDYYKNYTPDEIKYLPLNTVLYGPLQELNTVKAQPGSDASHSDSDDSTASDASCCSSSQGTHDGSGESSSGSEKNEKTKTVPPGTVSKPVVEKVTLQSQIYKPKIKPNAVCKVCKLGSGSGKDEKPEQLIHCSECDNSGHLSCLELPSEMAEIVNTYPWQCMDCKTCVVCRDPYDEDKMLFCDHCDRGYHTFCVGLKILPQGKWICQRCGLCAVCGATQPGPEGSKSQWQYDFIHPSVNVEVKRRQQIVCQTCFKRKR